MSNLTVTNINGLDADVGKVKSWINFDGLIASVRDSFNVSSLTDRAAGKFSSNFTNAMVNGNYAAVATTGYYNDTIDTNDCDVYNIQTGLYSIATADSAASDNVWGDRSMTSGVILGDIA